MFKVRVVQILVRRRFGYSRREVSAVSATAACRGGGECERRVRVASARPDRSEGETRVSVRIAHFFVQTLPRNLRGSYV